MSVGVRLASGSLLGLLVLALGIIAVLGLSRVQRHTAALQGELRGVRMALDIWGRQLRSFEDRLAKLERRRDGAARPPAAPTSNAMPDEGELLGEYAPEDRAEPQERVGSPGDLLTLEDLTPGEHAWLARQELLGSGVERRSTLLRGAEGSIGALTLIDKESGEARVEGDAPTSEAQELSLLALDVDLARRRAFDLAVERAAPVLATREEARRYAEERLGGRKGKQIAKVDGGFVILDAKALLDDADVRAASERLQRRADELGVEYHIGWMGKD